MALYSRLLELHKLLPIGVKSLTAVHPKTRKYYLYKIKVNYQNNSYLIFVDVPI